MTKNNEVFELTQEEFLKEYVNRDEDFEELLKSEFSIEM